MKSWAFALSMLAVLPVNAYVQNWNHDTNSSDAIRRLERRADTCPSDNPVACSSVDSQLPSNFCCGQGTTCLSIAQSTAAICCPQGQSCENIGTINCDVSLQNASTNKGPIFTTNLSGKLPTCGGQCCPFGYTCGQSDGKDVCVLNKAQAGAASTTHITSTTSATITTTPTSTASGIDSNNPPPTKEASNFPAGVFFAGFFPGIVVGILATLAWVVLTKRNNKPADNRGLNMSGTNGERPFISAPLKDYRHSNERSDFLGRTRSRARSMFSTHRRSHTMATPEMFGVPKMPTPPSHNNVPVNYINDMPDVPVTPHRRVARYRSEEDFRFSHDPSMFGEDKGLHTFSPVSPETEAETQRGQENAPVMPAMPQASIPPLRGMNTRRVSPPYGAINVPSNGPEKLVHPAHMRKDSGTAMGITIGSPFQTPEKKPTIVKNATPSMHATYHDAATLDSPEDGDPTRNENNNHQLQTLTPARYNPNSKPSQGEQYHKAAHLATKNLTTAQRSLPSQQQQKPQKPPIPPRPVRPDTAPNENNDFDFDEGLDDYTPHPQQQESQSHRQVNQNATFDSLLLPDESDRSRKDKHATNATTFTTMLRNVGFPDPGNQLGAGARDEDVPEVPKLNVGAKVQGKKGGNAKVTSKGKGIKGMI